MEMTQQRIFLYEFATSGGMWRLMPDASRLTGSLVAEGSAMRQALHEDLRQWCGLHVQTLRDARWMNRSSESASEATVAVHSARAHDDAFDEAIQSCEACLIVAPEIDGILLELSERVVQRGGRLLSPDPAFVALTSDKARCMDRLFAAQIPCPATVAWDAAHVTPEVWDAIRRLTDRFDWVVKPNDGAGSQQLRRGTKGHWIEPPPGPSRWCLQVYCPGRPASVSAIGDGRRWQLLPPCWQILEPETLAYRGGATMDEVSDRRRAWRLAEQVLAALPPTQGYVGIDLILGTADDGSGDVVIEVNPRLTTSYVGLRQLVRENLAAAMLRLPLDANPWSYRPGSIQFDAQGGWRRIESVPGRQRCGVSM